MCFEIETHSIGCVFLAAVTSLYLGLAKLFPGGDAPYRFYGVILAGRGHMLPLEPRVIGWIHEAPGRDLSLRVAEILTYSPTEYSGPQQKMLTETTLVRLDRTLSHAVDLMLANIQEPLTIKEISRSVDVPDWTLARVFKRYLKTTPASYYRKLRLTQAKHLIHNSSYRLGEIGALCGFDNPESFSRAYRRQFGVCASVHRLSEPS